VYLCIVFLLKGFSNPSCNGYSSRYSGKYCSNLHAESRSFLLFRSLSLFAFRSTHSRRGRFRIVGGWGKIPREMAGIYRTPRKALESRLRVSSELWPGRVFSAILTGCSRFPASGFLGLLRRVFSASYSRPSVLGFLCQAFSASCSWSGVLGTGRACHFET